MWVKSKILIAMHLSVKRHLEKKVYFLMNGEVNLHYSKADSAPAHRPPPPLKFFQCFFFWKFWQHNTHKLYCNQHATFKNMYIIQYSRYKRIAYDKTISKPQQLYCIGTAPPNLYIPGSATVFVITRVFSFNWNLFKDNFHAIKNYRHSRKKEEGWKSKVFFFCKYMYVYRS